MKDGIHPEYTKIPVKCSCGHQFEIGSVIKGNLTLDVCNACHPFYTGNQKVIDREARVKNFNDRFGSFSLTPPGSDTAGEPSGNTAGTA
jgi:large subunit ribosomal protein L31